MDYFETTLLGQKVKAHLSEWGEVKMITFSATGWEINLGEEQMERFVQDNYHLIEACKKEVAEEERNNENHVRYWSSMNRYV